MELTEAQKQLIDVDLPKWPQMLVKGKTLTHEQAMEVIRRTDSFFSDWASGNDRNYIAQVKAMFGIPDTDERGISQEESSKRYEALRKWQKEWGCIQTQYVSNSWVSSAYIYGPNGWCHPSGKISYVDNIGKWPDTEDVYQDWVVLAEAFPFLEVGVVLMDGEHSEMGRNAVFKLCVKDGQVYPVTLDIDVHEGFSKVVTNRSDNDLSAAVLSIMSGHSREHGLSNTYLTQMLTKGREYVAQSSIG